MYCGWNLTSCLYLQITQPNYDESISDWWDWYNNTYLKFYCVNLFVFLCLLSVATIITIVAIGKQFQYIANLKREYALDINKAAFILHAVLMLLQVVTSFTNMFTSIAYWKSDFGPKMTKVYNVCFIISIAIDFFIQLCI